MSCRIYTPVNGRCIHGDQVIDTERDRATVTANAGVSLVIETAEHRVSGFLPLRRGGTDEGSVAFVDVAPDEDPLIAYRDTVESVVDEREGWKTRDGEPATRLWSEFDVGESCPSQLRQRIEDEPDPLVGVSDEREAMEIIRSFTEFGSQDTKSDRLRHEITASNSDLTVETVAVTQTGGTGGLNADLVVHIDEEAYDEPTLVESLSESLDERVDRAIGAISNHDHPAAVAQTIDKRLSDMGLDIGISYDGRTSDRQRSRRRVLAAAFILIVGVTTVWSWVRLGPGTRFTVGGVAVFNLLARLAPLDTYRVGLLVFTLGFGLLFVSTLQNDLRRTASPAGVEASASAVVDPLKTIEAQRDKSPVSVLESVVEPDPNLSLVENPTRRRVKRYLVAGAAMAVVASLGWLYAQVPSVNRIHHLLVVGAGITAAVHRQQLSLAVIRPVRAAVRLAYEGSISLLESARSTWEVVAARDSPLVRRLVYPEPTVVANVYDIPDTSVPVERMAPLGSQLTLLWGSREDEGYDYSDERSAESYRYELLGAGDPTTCEITTPEPRAIDVAVDDGSSCVLTNRGVLWFHDSVRTPCQPVEPFPDTSGRRIIDIDVGTGIVAATLASGEVRISNGSEEPRSAAWELDLRSGERHCALGNQLVYSLDDSGTCRVYRHDTDRPVNTWRIPPSETIVDTAASRGYFYIVTESGSRYRICKTNGGWEFYDYGLDTQTPVVAVESDSQWLACATENGVWYCRGDAPTETKFVALDGPETLRVRDGSIYVRCGCDIHRLDPRTGGRRSVRFESGVDEFVVLDRPGQAPLIAVRANTIVQTAPIHSPERPGWLAKRLSIDASAY